MLPALLFKTLTDLTLVTIECRNFFRSVSDSQGASAAAAECSHTVSMATHVLPVWETCPLSASNREQRSRPAVPAVRRAEILTQALRIPPVFRNESLARARLMQHTEQRAS